MTDRPGFGEREYCDDDHDWIRVDVVEWSTGYPELDERKHTVVYDCADCDARRWSAEDKTASLEEWGAA